MILKSREIMKSNEEKLIVLYLLDKVDMNMAFDEIHRFIEEHELMNYMTLYSSLYELHSEGYLEKVIDNNNDHFFITDSGVTAVAEFDKLIPMSVRTKIMSYVDSLKIKVDRQNEICAQIFEEPETNSWKVKCTVSDSDFVLMELNISVFSKEEAINIAKNWEETCTKLYGTILGELTVRREIIEDDEEATLTEDEMLKILKKNSY